MIPLSPRTLAWLYTILPELTPEHLIALAESKQTSSNR